MKNIRRFLRGKTQQPAVAAVPNRMAGPIGGEVLGPELLLAQARRVARRQVIQVNQSRDFPSGKGPLLKRLEESSDILLSITRKLAEASARGVDISSAGDWLLDNHYIIQEHIRDIRTSLPGAYYQELPKLVAGGLTNYPRVYELALELIGHTEGRLDLANISPFVTEFQRVAPLRLGELWAIPTMLRLGLIENVRRMALRTAERLAEVELADQWSERLRMASTSNEKLTEELGHFVNQHPPLTPIFVARFLSQIRSYQTSFAPLVWIEQWIAEDSLTAEDAVTRSNRRIAITQVNITNSINSLRAIARLDWKQFIEEHSTVERILRQDPSGKYGSMTFGSRDSYRHVIELLSKRSQYDEDAVAKLAIDLAATSDPLSVRSHVGYWLLDDGKFELEKIVGYRLSARENIYRWALKHPSAVYFSALVLVMIVALAISVSAFSAVLGSSAWMLVVLLLIPASEVSVVTVNQLVTLLVRPKTLPKMQLSEGSIPDEDSTVIVVPTLFGSIASVHEALEHIEVQYLANKDPNIKFAILSDFTDSKSERTALDEHITRSAIRGIKALNERYGNIFSLLHRARSWNESEGVWMGWERKRGKLAQLNRLLQTGDSTPFVVTEGDIESLVGLKYVITLDSDTVLPRGAAHLMIGAITHPLNRPVYNEASRTVTRGYGILQPRVGIALTSAHRSKFAAIHSGHPGVDPYTTAVSDVYQDLYGEGSFTGKGIYHVETFERSTHGRFPENTLLSHDLIEGNYARAGLLTDVEVYDDYPSRYLSFTRRKHRWIRGDWQIVGWLKDRVPGPKGTERNRLNSISRWKIFDNLRRSLVEMSQLLLLFAGWFLLPGSVLRWTILAAIYVAFPWILSTVVGLLRPPLDQSWRAYYSAVLGDIATNAQQFALTIAFLPHQAVVSGDAILRTLYRINISRNRFLEWQTAAHVERAMKDGADKEAYKRMWPAVLIGVFAIVYAAALVSVEHDSSTVVIGILVATLPLGFVWVWSPKLATALSAPAIPGELKLSESEREVIARYAKLHWKYFDTFVSERTNWLAPDNFQGTPEPLVAYRTSPTNMGLQLMSVISAADLGIITVSEMVDRLDKIFNTLAKLPRHNGHFYNWYDIEELTVLEPAYISTVDSGNMAGHLVAVKQACIERLREIQPKTTEFEVEGRSLADGLVAASSRDQSRGTLPPAEDEDSLNDDELARSLKKLADLAFQYAMEMDFRFLFDNQRKLFSIGYNTAANTYDNSYYDLLASESRLTSFIAIAKGDIEVEHWFKLGRSLAEAAGTRVLVSWSGSMFEYLMPHLVTRSYQFTLLDQTAKGAVREHIEYGIQKGSPWGISESAYNGRDRAMVYQYKAFGVPRLALKRGMGSDLVVAPYATVLAMLIEPRLALKNLSTLESLGALGLYGFRDAVDYTRPDAESDKGIVDNYMAHHIGMSLVALTNALQRQIWQRRFHADPLVRSNELVLHERIPRKLVLQEKIDVTPIPKYTSEAERPSVRVINTPHTAQPRVSLLGSIPNVTMITNSGGGFSRHGDIVVTRWRRDTTRDNQGEWIYLKDVSSGRVWSASHQPIGVDADEYSVQFGADKAQFNRRDGSIKTQMDVVVSSDDAATVRRLTITNTSPYVREIEVTSYAEIVLQSLDADRQHPAFGNLFIQTEWSEKNSALLATRRLRASTEKPVWAAHVVSTGEERVGPITYETDRAIFIGRGKSVRHPEALEDGVELSQTVGAPLDPIFSLRTRLRIMPGKMAQVSFTTLVADTKDRALQLADFYDNPYSAKRAFELSWAQSQAELRELGIPAADAAIYQQLAGYILYPHPRLRPTEEEFSANKKGQQSLWPLGISGDLPILLATIESKDGLPSVKQLLQAHQYWRIKGIACDLIILNEHPPSYIQDLSDEVHAAIMASGESVIMDRPGGVFLRRTDVMNEEETALLRSMARVHIVCDGLGLGSLLELPDQREDFAGRLDAKVQPKYIRRVAGLRMPDIEEDGAPKNGFGQFNEDGEYQITLNNTSLPPSPWSNVVANKYGGFIVSESGSSCTWAGNSFFYRLTPWHNDPVRDPCSDCIYLKDEDTGYVWTATPAPVRELSAYTVKHGFGYSEFIHDHSGVLTELCMSMAVDDPVKISRLKIRNNTKTIKRITVTSYVELVLGVSRDISQQYIQTSYSKELGAILGRNYFDETYANKVAFLAMSGEIHSYGGDRRAFIGRNGTPASPAALEKRVLSESVGATVDPCAALQSVFVIDPDSEVEVIVILGAGESYDLAQSLIKKYLDCDSVKSEISSSVQLWKDRLTAFVFETPDAEFNQINNGWTLYQALSCRMWGRTALYQSSGAYGYRDQLQDCMAFVYTDPDLAKEHIIRAAGRQFVEGDVQHWWHPQTGRGVRTRFTDDLVWLPYVVEHYISVTGDQSILDETAPYITMRLLEPHEHEIYDLPHDSGEVGTIKDHCIRALVKASTSGRRDLPLIGCGDWNDGFSRVGIEGKGESVWLAWFLITTLIKFADRLAIVGLSNDYKYRDTFLQQAEKYRRAVEANGWDGAWYTRAFFDDGFPLGSHTSDEAKIDAVAQSWSVISGAGDYDRSLRAMHSLEQHLVREDGRLIMLLTPPFDKTNHDPGYIKGYLPGVRENGAQYTHAALWAVLARAIQGEGDKAFRLYQMINPLTHTRTVEDVDRYKAEPYVVAADVYTAEGHLGRGGWTWYTGSASWMFRVALESIVGFKKKGNSFTVAPSIPSVWKQFRLGYRFGSTTYNIEIKNPDGLQSGVRSVSIDGKALPDKTVRIVDDGKSHVVEVMMGHG